RYDAGAAYVVFGKTDTKAVDVSKIAAGAGGGFAMQGGGGIVGLAIGTHVAGIGDVNGDGMADLLLTGSYYYYGWTSNAFVVFGKSDTKPLTMRDIDSGVGGFRVWDLYGPFGPSAGPAGDINGDGLADLVIAAPSMNPSGAYVIFGK